MIDKHLNFIALVIAYALASACIFLIFAVIEMLFPGGALITAFIMLFVYVVIAIVGDE